MGTVPYKCPSVEEDLEWSPYADVWALAVTFYEVLTKAPLFKDSTSFNVELTEQPPTGFPKTTFEAICEIIQGKGRVNREPESYESLFALPMLETAWTEIPEDVAKQFKISSKTQCFLTLRLMNRPDPRKPQSKNVLAKNALHMAGMPARAKEVERLRAVFSQLKARGVVDYSGKGGKKAMLSVSFLAALGRD